MDVLLKEYMNHRVPTPVPEGWLQERYEKKEMIPKAELEPHAYYAGYCRNSRIAMWDPAKQKFVYLRVKFERAYAEGLKHPEDDNGFDLFWPTRKLFGYMETPGNFQAVGADHS